MFEVFPTKEGTAEYLEIAKGLKNFLPNQEGFISIERFKSLADENKVLSLSFWETEEAIEKWRNKMEHRQGQLKGKKQLFHSYRIHVAEVVRKYSQSERAGAPEDSNVQLCDTGK